LIRFLIPAAIALIATGIAYQTGVTSKLGAHPFWSDQILFWGAPAGIILGLIASRLRYAPAIIGSAFAAIIAYVIAHTGKIRFAASYAEDTTAGHMWFFGWNAVVIFAVATVFIAATKLSPRAKRK